MKIYYAHSKLIYGKKQEKDELKFLKTIFKNVVCPNNNLGELGSMEPYLRIVDLCGIVVCSTYRGYIGKGAYTEVVRAFENNIPVLSINKQIIRSVIAVHLYDSGDWKFMYATLDIL